MDDSISQKKIMNTDVKDSNDLDHEAKRQKLVNETWTKQLLVRVDELEKIIPEYQSNIARHNHSLDQTSKKVRNAAFTNNLITGTAFVFESRNQLNGLYESIKQLLLLVSETDDQSHLLKYASEYGVLKEKLETLGATPERVVTNEAFEKAYQFFEEAVTYYEDYELAVDLLKSIEMILSQHHQLIAELKVFYQLEDDFQTDKPNTHKLVKDMGRMKKRYPEFETTYLKRIKQKLPPKLAEELEAKLDSKLEQLSVGYFEFYLDQLYVKAALGSSINPKIGNVFEDVQEKIAKAKNMHQVWEASKDLPVGMERLYLLHWVYESLFKRVWKNKAKRGLFYPPEEKYSPTLGKALKGFITRSMQNMEKKDFNSLQRFLVDGVFFRNRVAHQGIIFSPEQFSGAVSAYQSGGRICTQFLDHPLYKVPKEADVQIDLDKAQETLSNFLEYKAVGDSDENSRTSNGFRDEPDTWLTLDDVQSNPDLKDALYDMELALNYGLSGKDIGWKFNANFENLLARHFSNLFLGRTVSIKKMRVAYREGMVKRGLLKENEEKMLPGFSRALFMVGKCTNLNDPLLERKSYYFKGQDTPSVKEVGLIIAQELTQVAGKERG